MSTVPFPFDLGGQVAIVTGGGTGIGEATTRLLASVGADVLISSRKVANLERVASEVETLTGRRILALQGDVRDEASCQAIVDRTVEAFGRIDILVNNAGAATCSLSSTPAWTVSTITSASTSGARTCSPRRRPAT